MGGECSELEVIDFDTFNEVISEIKKALYAKWHRKYTVLIVDNVYCFVANNLMDKCTTRFKMYRICDVALRINVNNIEILKNQVIYKDINQLLSDKGLHFRDKCPNYIDEE